MSKITKIEAREILDSRGNPTLEVDTTVEEKFIGRFSVPSGASTGKYEALEKRDGDPEHFEGKGVEKLAKKIEEEIAPELYGKDFDQNSLDKYLIEKDGTENKSNFGANAILGLSVSFAKAEAKKSGVPLWKHIASLFGNEKPAIPTPTMNIINGGLHADSGLDIQEFMIVPLGDEPFKEKYEKCDEVYMRLKKLLEEKDLSTNLGDEGGFAPKLNFHTKALDFILEAVGNENFGIALDCAASEFFKDGKYFLKSENREFNSSELSDYYEKLMKDYPIISIEDPFDQDDWDAWTEFNQKFGKKLMIVGDDLFVTNPKRLEEGINKRAANSILVKLNQIGTLSETLEVIKKAKEADFRTIISHRSGETEDTSIAHLAVGTSSPFIKSGAPSRDERVAKYNELLRIEEDLKKD